MKKKYSIYFIMIIFFIFGCRTERESGTDMVAQVNSAKMTKSELEASIPENTSDEIRLLLKRELMEKWIEDEIFYQSAIDEGISLTEEEKKFVYEYEKQLIVQKYLEKKINIDYHILDRDIDDYYNKNKEEFIWDDDYVRIIHLVMENRDNAIINEIRKSKELIDIIRKNFFDLQSKSERPIGDLGYVKISDLPAQISGALKYMKTGEINYNPIRTEYGYHFIQLIDYKKAGEVKNLDLIKEDIILRLKLEKRNMEMEKLKQKLRENFNIMTDLSKLSQ
jgi:parvulin-like peptidyl-prolyl isomerase